MVEEVVLVMVKEYGRGNHFGSRGGDFGHRKKWKNKELARHKNLLQLQQVSTLEKGTENCMIRPSKLVNLLTWPLDKFPRFEKCTYVK